MPDTPPAITAAQVAEIRGDLTAIRDSLGSIREWIAAQDASHAGAEDRCQRHERMMAEHGNRLRALELAAAGVSVKLAVVTGVGGLLLGAAVTLILRGFFGV